MYLADLRGRGTAVSRAGFTLIELMIVLALIGILSALVAGTVSKIVTVGQENTTKNTLKAIQSQITVQWKKVTEMANAEQIPSNAQAVLQSIPVGKTTVNLIGTDINATQRMRVIWIKYRQRQAFPQSFAEIANPDPLGIAPPLVNYAGQLNAMQITSISPTAVQPLESSVCLLLALEHGPGRVDKTGDTYGTAVGNGFLYNGVPVRAFKDSWDNVMGFCRWPAHSTRINPPASTATLNGAPQPGKSNDRADPTGLLVDTNWLSTANKAATNEFARLFHPVGTVGSTNTFNLTPVVISGGVDQNLGVNVASFLATTNLVQEQDNFYSTLLP